MYLVGSFEDRVYMTPASPFEKEKKEAQAFLYVQEAGPHLLRVLEEVLPSQVLLANHKSSGEGSEESQEPHVQKPLGSSQQRFFLARTRLVLEFAQPREGLGQTKGQVQREEQIHQR